MPFCIKAVPLEQFQKRGIGKPDPGKTEFVSSIEDIDYALTLPTDDLAKFLGKPPDQLEGGLVRIDFIASDKIGIPTGNEFSAFDEAWIPGGYTDGGAIEAVVKTEGMVEGVDYIVTVL